MVLQPSLATASGTAQRVGRRRRSNSEPKKVAWLGCRVTARRAIRKVWDVEVVDDGDLVVARTCLAHACEISLVPNFGVIAASVVEQSNAADLPVNLHGCDFDYKTKHFRLVAFLSNTTLRPFSTSHTITTLHSLIHSTTIVNHHGSIRLRSAHRDGLRESSSRDRSQKDWWL